MGDEQDALSKTEFWQRAAAVAFALWALAIPFGVSMIRDAAKDIVKLQTDQSAGFNQYVLAMEKRVTLIEERQARTLTILADHDGKIDRIENRK